MSTPSRAPRGPVLDLDIQFAVAGERPARRALRAWVRAAFTAAQLPSGALTVRLVDEAESAALNGAHRGKPAATNVLAFPAAPDWPCAPGAPRPLGDVVVCLPRAAQEAAAFGKTLEARLAHLVVHGVLHLAGHDHHRPAPRRRMETLERAALAALGLPDPYLAGASAPAAVTP